MTTKKKSLEEVRDFALYGLKAFQDVLIVAFKNSDLATLTQALEQFMRLFEDFLSRPDNDSIQFLELQIERTPDPERDRLQRLYDKKNERQQIADSLLLAKDQIIFGISARALELTLSGDDETKLQMYWEFEKRLPTTSDAIDQGI